MSPRRVPVSRRDRPSKAPLSREGAVAAALRIMQEEGLERVTVRRLAAELDTGPASLYVYVQNVAELHAAIVDELLAGLELPVAGLGWRAELIETLTAYTAKLIQYPSLARSVLTLRPSGPNYVRLIDVLLGLLHQGGVPDGQAAWGVDLLLQYATSTAAEQGTRGEAVEAESEHFALIEAVRETDPERHPHLARARDHLFSGTGRQRLHWMLDVVITGIAAVPTPT